MIRRAASIALILTLSACDRSATSSTNSSTATIAAAAPNDMVVPVILPPKPTVGPNDKNWPPAPRILGGLPDDRRPLPEMNRDMTGSQGAASALETYVVNVEGKHWTRAHQQWGDERAAVAFEERWRDVSEIHGLVGTPGDTEGGCGSIYADVPVQFYGTRLNGSRFNSIGKAVMRRVNGVDGATPRELSWHVDSVALRDTH